MWGNHRVFRLSMAIQNCIQTLALHTFIMREAFYKHGPYPRISDGNFTSSTDIQLMGILKWGMCTCTTFLVFHEEVVCNVSSSQQYNEKNIIRVWSIIRSCLYYLKGIAVCDVTQSIGHIVINDDTLIIIFMPVLICEVIKRIMSLIH